MPDLMLTGREVQALSAYLLTLKLKRPGSDAAPSVPGERGETTAEDIEKGRRLVRDLGCTGCHETGRLRFQYIAPPLDNIGDKRPDELFFGSIIPGIILASLMMLTVYLICLRHKDWGPAGPQTTMWEKIVSLKGAGEMLVLFSLVMGGLFVGFFTPSEAGAVGSFFALLISLIRRTMTRTGFFKAVED
ncbi:MAG: hypothetical protein DSY83_09050, partial [Flavobacteriia bacterium]